MAIENGHSKIVSYFFKKEVNPTFDLNINLFECKLDQQSKVQYKLLQYIDRIEKK